MSVYSVPCKCGSHHSNVRDSRPMNLGHTRRRRVCASCGNKFTTYEVSEKDYKLIHDYTVELSKFKERAKQMRIVIDRLLEDG